MHPLLQRAGIGGCIVSKLISLAVIFIALTIKVPANATDLPDQFDIQEIEVVSEGLGRILPDESPDRAWIVIPGFGIGLVDNAGDGPYRFTPFQVGVVIDACGPDADGKIYMIGIKDGVGTGYYSFDCPTLASSEFVKLSDDHIVTEILLSNDESKLYIVGWDWPRYGEYYSSGERSGDLGLVWEVDKETGEITREGGCGMQPNNAILGSGNLMMIGTANSVQLAHIDSEMCYHGPTGNVVDVFNIDTFERELRYDCGEGYGWEPTNQFFRWSDDGRYVAQCSVNPAPTADQEIYEDTIWIFDLVENELVETIKPLDQDELPIGVINGMVSLVWDGVAIVTGAVPYEIMTLEDDREMRYSIFLIDIETGAFLAGIEGDPMIEWIHQLSDGSILFTSGYNNYVGVANPN